MIDRPLFGELLSRVRQEPLKFHEIAGGQGGARLDKGSTWDGGTPKAPVRRELLQLCLLDPRSRPQNALFSLTLAGAGQFMYGECKALFVARARAATVEVAALEGGLRCRGRGRARRDAGSGQSRGGGCWASTIRRGALRQRWAVVCVGGASQGNSVARAGREIIELAQECVGGRLKRECWIWRRGRELALAAANQVAGGRARGRLARSRIRAPLV